MDENLYIFFNLRSSNEQSVIEKDPNYDGKHKAKELEFEVSNEIKSQIQLSNSSLSK